MDLLRFSLILGISLSGVIGAYAAQTAPAAPPNSSPNSSKSQLWQNDFNPQTRDERVDTDTSTDEDVIIMEEDEDSENLPGNSENAPQ